MAKLNADILGTLAAFSMILKPEIDKMLEV